MIYTSNLSSNLTILASDTVRVTITPGAGEMADADWDSIENHPTIEDLIEQRVLLVQEVPVKKAKTITKTPPVPGIELP